MRAKALNVTLLHPNTYLMVAFHPARVAGPSLQCAHCNALYFPSVSCMPKEPNILFIHLRNAQWLHIASLPTPRLRLSLMRGFCPSCVLRKAAAFQGKVGNYPAGRKVRAEVYIEAHILYGDTARSSSAAGFLQDWKRTSTIPREDHYRSLNILRILTGTEKCKSLKHLASATADQIQPREGNHQARAEKVPQTAIQASHPQTHPQSKVASSNAQVGHKQLYFQEVPLYE